MNSRLPALRRNAAKRHAPSTSPGGAETDEIAAELLTAMNKYAVGKNIAPDLEDLWARVKGLGRRRRK